MFQGSYRCGPVPGSFTHTKSSSDIMLAIDVRIRWPVNLASTDNYICPAFHNSLLTKERLENQTLNITPSLRACSGNENSGLCGQQISERKWAPICHATCKHLNWILPEASVSYSLVLRMTGTGSVLIWQAQLTFL